MRCFQSPMAVDVKCCVAKPDKAVVSNKKKPKSESRKSAKRALQTSKEGHSSCHCTCSITRDAQPTRPFLFKQKVIGINWCGCLSPPHNGFEEASKGRKFIVWCSVINATVETANWRNRFHLEAAGRCEQNKLVWNKNSPQLVHGLRGLVAVMAHTREWMVVSLVTDIPAVRWFKALPSRQFGPAPSFAWEHVNGLQIIEVYSEPGK
jgi:hypothetical protein